MVLDTKYHPCNSLRMTKLVLLTTSQIADQLQVDPSTVRKWVAKGLLKAVTLPGGHHRFRQEDIEALLAEAAS